MNVNSLTDSGASFKLPDFSIAAPAKLLVKDAATASAASASQIAQSKVPATVKTSGTVSNNKPARAMSHIVESYNAQGKVRTKYMDSNNNVIYQTPSEMVAKAQDLMTNTQASNIKA